ncbi:MAG: hypothetical protein ACXABY_25970 [Candidatus Thorarchaeota archaeon]|jgi:hypothetical protein
MRFITPELEEENDQQAAKVWLETFSEPIPPPVVGARVRKIMRTEEGRRRVAEAFGKVIKQEILKEKR